ncbi:hypothetical protein H0H87_006692 [Tephrocybe sp. NHM501043]|nr:hypothetical protein H0H87_006692 [Tephrocybe sp. NHM501043]
MLMNLTSDNTVYRFQTCNALSGVVLAKFSHPDFPHEDVSKELHSFLKPQIPPQELQMPAFSQDDYPLHHLLQHAFESQWNDTKEPLWAIITIASLITLADRWLYTYKEIAFIADKLRPALTHKRREVRQLARAAWGCLVWAFTLLPIHPTWLKPEDPSIDATKISLRGKAFRFLKNDITGGKGGLLVWGLLSSHVNGDEGTSGAGAGNLSRALLVLKTMITGSGSDSETGVRMLCALLRASKDDRHNGSMTPNLRLFDGAILDAPSHNVRDIAKRISGMTLDHFRPLSETEITDHWTVLVDAWVEAVDRTLQSSLQLPSNLLDAWQSLLLMKANLTHLTEEHAHFGQLHLIASSSFARQIASIVSRFLIQSEETAVQVFRLIAVKRLWAVMKNVFATSWLPAERILASVLRINFSLQIEEVKEAWSELCADLISVGVPTLLHVISTGSEGQEVSRHLWCVLARTWQVADEKAHWESFISFLVIPFKSWLMSGAEVELWEGVLRSSMVMADANAIEPNVVVDRFFLRLGEKKIDALVAFPQIIASLAACINLSGCTALPCPLLAAIDRTLLTHYPPRPEFLSASLKVIQLLSQMIVAVPRKLLIQLLCTVEKGMRCWIGDEQAALLTGEHDVVVQGLYCSTLKLLRDIPHSLETLVAIAPFLSSAFGRLSSCAIGPLTFNEYWRATYHGVEEYRSSYPDCLKVCLLGFSDAYGGSIAEGLSLSQGTYSSSIPDSQPSYLGHEEAWLTHLEHGKEGKYPPPIQPPHASLEPPAKRIKIVYPHTLPSTIVNVLGREQSVPFQTIESVPAALHPIASSQEVFRESPLGLATPHLTPQVAASSKEPSPKRSHADFTGNSFFFPKLVPQVKRTFPDSQRSKRRKTQPEPTLNQLRIMDSVPPPTESLSQDTDTRKRKRIIEWVNISKNLRSSMHRGDASRVGSTAPATPITATMRASPPTLQVDYNTREAELPLMHEIMELQQELVGPDVVSESDFQELDEESDLTSDPADFSGGFQIAKGSKHVNEHERHRRSYTVPQRPTGILIQRTSTSSSARLEALEHAYTAVANVESQIAVEDLVQASGLVNKIQSALTEHLTRRIANSEPSDDV